VRVYNEHGIPQRNGTGLFPSEMMNRFPLLPVEEEGRLNDMPLRENFIERVFAYGRKPGRLRVVLANFHSGMVDAQRS
jgi:hypothetical protein